MLGQQGFGLPNLAAVPTAEQAPPPETAAPQGWFCPLSKAAPAVATVFAAGLVYVPTPAPAAPQGWYQQFSKAAHAASAIQSYPTFVAPPSPQYPFNWTQPLSKAPPVAAVSSSYSFVPFDTVQITPFTPNLSWLQPLSMAPRPAPNRLAAQPTFIVAPFDIPRGWFAPLSVSVRSPSSPSSRGLIYAPIAAPTGIAGMAWFMPLGTATKAQTVNPTAQLTFPLLISVSPGAPPVVHDRPFFATVGRLMSPG